jgi:hypothetical protein
MPGVTRISGYGFISVGIRVRKESVIFTVAMTATETEAHL